MSKNKKLTPELVDQIRYYHDLGVSSRRISQLLGRIVSHSTICKIVKRDEKHRVQAE